VAFSAFCKARVDNSLVRHLEIIGAMAAYAEPVIDLPRVQLYSLVVGFVCRIALLFVAVRAFLKLIDIGDVLHRVVAASTGNARANFMGKRGIGIDLAFVFSVIKQHCAAAAGRVEFDCYSLSLALRLTLAL
jgi:hypothetical protein